MLRENFDIKLSPSHLSGEEMDYLGNAISRNEVSAHGQNLDLFEKRLKETLSVKGVTALSSGTAAIHLALRYLDVGPGDTVMASTLTFIGSVSPILFQGAKPIFIDSDKKSWNMDPDLLEEALFDCQKAGEMPRAVLPTDLYGQCADYRRIIEICRFHNIPVIVDAAEALGAKYRKVIVKREKGKVREKGEKRKKVVAGEGGRKEQSSYSYSHRKKEKGLPNVER